MSANLGFRSAIAPLVDDEEDAIRSKRMLPMFTTSWWIRSLSI